MVNASYLLKHFETHLQLMVNFLEISLLEIQAKLIWQSRQLAKHFLLGETLGHLVGVKN
jgi:hypothetical protein